MSKKEHGEEKVDSTVKEDRFRGGEKGQPKRTSLVEVEGSISERVNAKAIQDNLQSAGFTPKSGQA